MGGVTAVMLSLVFGKAIRLQPHQVRAFESNALAGRRTEERQVAGGSGGTFKALQKVRGLQAPL